MKTRVLIKSAALLIACFSIPALAARLLPGEADRIRLIRDSGNVHELEATLRAYHSGYKQGMIDDEQENFAIRAAASVDPAMMPVYDQWVAAYPTSYVAHTVRGRAYIERGYNARGSRWISQTSKAQLDEMRTWLEKARADLQKATTLSDKPVSALAELLWVNLPGGRDPVESAEILRKALTLDNRAFAPRRNYTNFLQPRWGGEMPKLQSFVNKSRQFLQPDQQRWMDSTLEEERVDSLLRPAIALAAQKKPQEAINLYNEILKTEKVPLGFQRRGNAYADLKMWDLALQDFQRALELDPSGECCDGIHASLAKGQLENRQIQEGLANLIEAAERENTWAMREVAIIFAFGRYGMKPDYVQARRWCGRAARQGDAMSMFCLGSIYDAGLGTPRDPAEAVKWLSKAAELGVDDARADLAFIYWHGQGVPQDREKALTLWIAASKNGHSRSISQLNGKLTGWERFQRITWPEIKAKF